MNSSEKFENILDKCLERLLVKGETVEQCLQSFPEHVDELKPLLETALTFKKASSAIMPSPELKDKARYRFYSALQEMAPRKRGRSVFGWQPLWIPVAVIILVLLLAGGGTVVAAGGSMPDEFLYPVKLATEQAQLALTFSTLGKAELYARLADKRVAEIARMADENKPEQIERASQRLDTYLNTMADLVSPQVVMRSAASTAVAPAAATEEAPEIEPAPPLTIESAPATIAPAPPPEVEVTPPTVKAPLMSEQAKVGKDESVIEDPRARLRETVLNQASENSARLRALLDTVPESARPALLQAIAVSEAGYERALEALAQP